MQQDMILSRLIVSKKEKKETQFVWFQPVESSLILDLKPDVRSRRQIHREDRIQHVKCCCKHTAPPSSPAMLRYTTHRRMWHQAAKELRPLRAALTLPLLFTAKKMRKTSTRLFRASGNRETSATFNKANVQIVQHRGNAVQSTKTHRRTN